MELCLIDGIGPFFQHPGGNRINWSKIPFARIPEKDPEAARYWEQVRNDLSTFAQRSVQMGFNALTLDSLGRLTDHPWYEPQVRGRIKSTAREFGPLLNIVEAAGLRLFVTSDVITTTPAIERRLGTGSALTAFYYDLVNRFFDEFPQAEGLILRIGESDGTDVGGIMRSRLHLRTAKQTNRFLRDLLPVFEQHDKKLILRTWTVGAHRIGDLIWHRDRQRRALDGLESDHLILSMKAGESDFFRYLPLNRAFHRYDGPKILELQARREYEGAGEFPSYTGWECERLRNELAGAANVVGLSVWCQTGGWHRFKRRTFLEPGSPWVELNCRAAIDVFREGLSAEESIHKAMGESPKRSTAAVELLRRADRVMNELYYIRSFASQKLFFRRVRIPPLLHVYWDCLFVHESLRRIIRYFVPDHQEALQEGEEARALFSEMVPLAKKANLPVEDIELMRDTCDLIALARRYFFSADEDAPGLLDELRAAKKRYKTTWPRSKRPRYRIKTAFHLPAPGPLSLGVASHILLRRKRGYRLVDRVFTLGLLSYCYRIFRNRHGKALPKFVRKSAMGIDTVFE